MKAVSADPDEAARTAEADTEAEAQAAARAVTRWLLDATNLSPIALCYAAIYTRARVRFEDVRRRNYRIWLLLLEGELVVDPRGFEAEEQITPAAREELHRIIDSAWIVIMSSVNEKHRQLTAEAVRRAARELAFDRGYGVAVALYCGAVAEALIRSVPVAELICGDIALTRAQAETEAIEAGNTAVCERWVACDVWADICERAGNLLRANEVGAA
ncbi:Uncharacterised protein [Mycobacteroides abscessus subsp. bolletii]|uniref:hypothetical protein n=1 Tax=Mycobacteroides abscessus TaxID=36809 RepID=UPI0009A88D42|nr:hypothetical protein [Mycobacteroides abscessus]SKY21989.1 Uncharacterised protein [Mycobacteroides abscessus subsp. bolletii]